MKNVRVAAVQMEHRNGDKEFNFAKIEGFCEQAKKAGVQIVAFPECCITGYWFLRNLSRDQLLALAEPVPGGPSTRHLAELSRKTGMTIGAGLVELADDGKMYNTYVAAMPDGKTSRHRKINAFENDHISSGSEYTVFDTPHGCRVGMLICYDNNILENVRITALKGAEILLAPHQTGGCDSSSPLAMKPVNKAVWANRAANPRAVLDEFRGDKGRGWLMRWLPSRAHDNGLFLVFANGVGEDDDEVRTGNAMILDCYGRIVCESISIADDMVVGDLDASLIDRCTGRRWLRTRRPDLYGPLTVPTGIEQDTRKVRFEHLRKK
ncbi:MAG: acyltransferase [Planctomycetes bacterium]|nr:acyltransferase [Planctomycetota bacterium]